METTNLIRRRTMEQHEKDKGGPSAEAVSKTQRLLRVDQIYSRKDRQIHFVKTAKPGISQAKYERLTKTVLVVRRIISKQGMVARIEVDIRSPALNEVLLEIFKDVEGLELNKSPPVADPELLFHAVTGLHKRLHEEESKKENQSKQLINDISAVMDFVREDFSGQMATLSSLSEKGEITYDLLWTLFPPKTQIFTKQNTLQEPQALIFKSGNYVQTQQGNYYDIDAELINHDGDDFGYGLASLRINEFNGSRKVDKLEVFPLSEYPELESMKKLLIERGRKYITLLEPACMQYSGVGVEEESTPQGAQERRFYATGRIMCDPAVFRMQNASADRILQPWVPTTIDAKQLKDDELLITHHRVQGFSFAKKTWGAFAVSKIEPVVWNEGAFTKLIMEPKKRALIHELVKSHRNDTDTVVFDDIIRDKGKGLIGLLSGSPGCGKTLTAEVVAELTHKPLYMVSAGELGTEVTSVDRQLEVILDITKRWGCVLLIDEADVFLQTRDDLNLLRNALVSIFLRRLEYFQGILILTTNKKRAIDAAFRSRIHFKIHYPQLNHEDRTNVWRNFLANVPAGVPKPTMSDDEVVQLAETKLNGREIKNALSCAFSISRERNLALTKDAVQEVLDILVDDWTDEE